MKNKKYITYDKYLNIEKKLSESRLNGLQLYYKKNYIKIGCGLICLGIAVFPNGMGIWAFPLAFLLLGLSFRDLEEFKRKIKNKFRQLHKKRGCSI